MHLISKISTATIKAINLDSKGNFFKTGSYDQVVKLDPSHNALGLQISKLTGLFHGRYFHLSYLVAEEQVLLITVTKAPFYLNVLDTVTLSQRAQCKKSDAEQTVCECVSFCEKAKLLKLPQCEAGVFEGPWRCGLLKQN